MESEFNKKRRGLIDHYFYIEESFIELTRIIPLDNPYATYSPRLYEILQSICSNVEGLSIIISDELQLEPKRKKFPFIYEILNKEGMLEKQIVNMFKLPGKENHTPLEKTGEHAPKWWDDYNETKHDLPQGLRAGNVGSTPMALARLYTLHVIGYFLQNVQDHDGFLDPKNWHVVESYSQNTDNREVDTGVMYNGPKSKIFSPMTFYNKEGAMI